MAEFNYNNGNYADLTIDQKYDKTKIYLNVDVIPDDDIIKIAGHSIVKCLKIEIEDVIFENHVLTYSNNLYGKKLEIEVNASKIKTEESDTNGSLVPITCKLNIEAGDDLLQEYELTDKKNLSANSIFTFRILFKQNLPQ